VWLPPFILDPHDNRIMYLPWRRDMWRNSDLTQIPYVFPPTPTDVNWEQLEYVKDNYITALGMSAAEPRRLYYGSIYGKLLYLDNPHEGQPASVEITGDNFPLGAYIHCIAVDPTDANKVIVVFPNYGVISIYASENGGATWTPVSGNLEEQPDGSGSGPSVRWVSILYVDDQPIYFAGTSVGLFSTTNLNGMETIWTNEGASTIGNLVIDMIDVRQSDGFVVVGTHGNGVYSTYITDLPSYIEEPLDYPTAFNLYPAYPNPFNSETTIAYQLPVTGHVSLKIYNALGEKVRTLVNGKQSTGHHQFRWDGKNDLGQSVSSGLYLYRIHAGDFQAVMKLIIVK